MKTFVMSPKVLSNQITSYLDEASPLVGKAFASARKSTAFRDIYKAAVATDLILSSLSDERIKPGMSSMRSVVVRIPLLIALGQSAVGLIELRRFLELSIWSIYFTHHPIEWQHFEGKRGKGFVKDPRLPISTAAHRDLNSYMEYAREYMEAEPSGHAIKALNAIESDKKILNAATHAGDVARQPATNVPINPLIEQELVKFAAIQRRLFSHCLVVMAAFNRDKYDRLPLEARAYWEWLLGNELQKSIRSAQFGLRV